VLDLAHNLAQLLVNLGAHERNALDRPEELVHERDAGDLEHAKQAAVVDEPDIGHNEADDSDQNDDVLGEHELLVGAVQQRVKPGGAACEQRAGRDGPRRRRRRRDRRRRHG